MNFSIVGNAIVYAVLVVQSMILYKKFSFFIKCRIFFDWMVKKTGFYVNFTIYTYAMT